MLNRIKMLFTRYEQFQTKHNGYYEYFAVPKKWLGKYIHNRYAIGKFPKAQYKSVKDFILQATDKNLAELEEQAKKEDVYIRLMG